MANKERFGKFILLEEIESSGLGAEYRAAKLGSGGLEKIVTVLRLGQAFSAHVDIAKGLMEQAKVAAQLQTPNILKILGIGKVEGTYYISYEFIEGKSLRAIFSRCRQESFPLSVDHALLIASKICSALEYAHSRKVEGAGRYYHGFLTPGNVVVSYEGELRVRGFGYWLARIRDAGGVSDEDLRYLAPEQIKGGATDTRSDIFAVGAVLFEALTGEPLFQDGRSVDVAGRLAHARLQNPTGDDDAIPRPIADILHRALTNDPAGRYAEVQELRKAIDTLLFSGDFTPTTFNLAFFMHSLFREDIERESKSLKQEREASYFEYLGDDSGKIPIPVVTPLPPPVVVAPPPIVVAPPRVAVTPLPVAAPPRVPTPPPVVVAPRMPTPAPVSVAPPAATPLPLIPPPPRPAPPPARVPTPPRPFVPPPVVSQPAPQPPAYHEPPPPARPLTPITISTPESPARREQMISGPILSHAETPRKRGMGGIIAAVLAAVLLLGGGVYYVVVKKPFSGPPQPTAAEIAKMKADLEASKAREAVLEKEKVDAIEKARQEAIADAEKQNLAKAEAQKRADAAAEKARKQQEEQQRQERDRLAAEQARIEADRVQAERQAAEQEKQRKEKEAEDARRAAVTPTPAPTPPPTPGTYAPDDPNVIPSVQTCPKQEYPAQLRMLRISGTVRLFLSIDEAGRISSIRVLSGPEALRQPAIDYYRKCTFTPSKTKDGRPARLNKTVAVVYQP
jgi:TonB family protein